jgi:hypothetical protein
MPEANCIVQPSTAYKLESKRFLFESDLRTPRLEMMSLEDPGTTQALTIRPLPFVVKSLIASRSHGTWLVTTEYLRHSMLLEVKDYKTRGGVEVQLSEYIESYHCYCVQFFVGPGLQSRIPLFTAVSVQTFAEDNTWAGAQIDYARQDEARSLFRETIADTIRSLPTNFSSWVGVDVMIDEHGKQYVVDLNPRMTSSIPICLLSGFFWTERRMRFAQIGSVEYVRRPDLIHAALFTEVEAGKVIIGATACLDELKPLTLAWLV